MAYRYDKDSVGGGLLLYIRDNIPTIFLKHDFETNIENLSVETDLRKRKWFFNCSYNPLKTKTLSHLSYLNLVCSKYNKVYDNLIFIGDFNVEWWVISIWQIFVLWTILKVWFKNQHVTKSTRIQHVLV